MNASAVRRLVMRKLLEQALTHGSLRQIDLHAGLFLQSLTSGNSEEVLLASALASRAVGEGHICLPLDKVAGQPVFNGDIDLRAPEAEQWSKDLLSSGVVGRPGDNTPLILDNADRLYLARYYNCEKIIGEDLLERSRGILDVDRKAAAALLNRLFPQQGEPNWQKSAAALALIKQFVLISGGPGTGKTYTVARIIALLQSFSYKQLRIALAAPTGKAAFRLYESIAEARELLDPELAESIPEETSTIHRLLGYHPVTGRYRNDEHNPLHLDLLVLDEASMIDVPLMAGIVKALPETARLIMLGDRDQLTSVEAGSLFGDICATDKPEWSPSLCRELGALTGSWVQPSSGRETFGDSVIILQESYRFGMESGIGELARLVVRGMAEEVVAHLRVDKPGELSFQSLDNEPMDVWLPDRLFRGFKHCFASSSAQEALAVFEQFRVLCAVREGETGISGVNHVMERMLRGKGIIEGDGTWYRGKPIMIMVNDYSLQLFNGDTGIVWPDVDGRLWAWFQRQGGELQKIALSRLPGHETAFAITVHKSQGSEFDEVVFLLPGSDSRVLNRELVYTGITRARKKLTICGNPGIIQTAVSRHVLRFSGLKDALWPV